MAIDNNRRYESADEFFSLGGSVEMFLTVYGAVQVCAEATERGQVVVKVEGGVWHHPGFEAKIWCVWDGVDPPVEGAGARRNNAEAAKFIQRKSRTHDTFVLTTAPITGYVE